MWVSRLEIENIRSWAKADFNFSRGINVLVGPNNSGKSTVIHALLALQQHLIELDTGYLRLGASGAGIIAHVSDSDGKLLDRDTKTIGIKFERNRRTFLYGTSGAGFADRTFPRFVSDEPDNFICPFLSHRNFDQLDESINKPTARRVLPDLRNLSAKIDQILNPQHRDAYSAYVRMCERLLGILVTTVNSERGKLPTYEVSDARGIRISAMGEGTPNVLALVAQLCVAKGKLFLLEEPENDIHPRALKDLLGFVRERAAENQVIVTTHSNVVVRHLAVQRDAKLFHINITFPDRLPTSSKVEVGDSASERGQVLESLGYELLDYDLWEAWLFLEESSAEKIIREYLIPSFVPELSGRLRTFSARSLSEVKPKFESFNRLFTYLHLIPTYRNKVWVIVDGGDDERKVIDSLKEMYCRKPDGEAQWSEEQFLQFNQHDFERYYPEQFRAEVDKVLELADKSERRERKKQLLRDVEDWIAENPDGAKTAFEQSAAEVIDKLHDIERVLAR